MPGGNKKEESNKSSTMIRQHHNHNIIESLLDTHALHLDPEVREYIVSFVSNRAQQNANSDDEELLETLISFLGNDAAKLIVPQLRLSSPKTGPTHRPTPKAAPLLPIFPSLARRHRKKM
jgi:hypothetical protein